MLIAYRKMRLLSLPLSNVIAFFTGVYYRHTTPRYRHPMNPVLTLLSAYALVYAACEIIEWTKNGSRKKAGSLASANG